MINATTPSTCSLLEQSRHVDLIRGQEQHRYRFELATIADDLEQLVCGCTCLLCDRIYYGQVVYLMRSMLPNVRQCNPQTLIWAKAHLEQASRVHADHILHHDAQNSQQVSTVKAA